MKDCVSLVGLWKLKSKSSAVISITFPLISLTFFWIKCMTPPTSFSFQKWRVFTPGICPFN